MSYRYDRPFGRRVRPPRTKAYCRTCRTLVDLNHLDVEGLCACCAATEPLFAKLPTQQSGGSN